MNSMALFDLLGFARRLVCSEAKAWWSKASLSQAIWTKKLPRLICWELLSSKFRIWTLNFPLLRVILVKFPFPFWISPFDFPLLSFAFLNFFLTFSSWVSPFEFRSGGGKSASLLKKFASPGTETQFSSRPAAGRLPCSEAKAWSSEASLNQASWIKLPCLICWDFVNLRFRVWTLESPFWVSPFEFALLSFTCWVSPFEFHLLSFPF